MKHFGLAAAILAFAAVPRLRQRSHFERNLTVNGHVELAVSTGSGHIHITHGSGDRVHIFGSRQVQLGQRRRREGAGDRKEPAH